MKSQPYKHALAGLTTAVLLAILTVNSATAWDAPYAYPDPYHAYTPGYGYAYPGYWQPPGHGAGWYGYAEPRWYMRGRMNRYGDYRIDIKLRHISMFDMYQMWLLFNGY